MLVTIICDASMCPNTNVGAYSAWVACDRGKKRITHAFKTHCVSSIHAEMMGIYNSLYNAAKEELIAKKDSVLIQTDCVGAILAFENMRKRISPIEIQVVTAFNKFVTNNELNITFKHVKGHTSGYDTRTLVNNVCDKHAFKKMTKARRQFRLNQLKKQIEDSK